MRRAAQQFIISTLGPARGAAEKNFGTVKEKFGAAEKKIGAAANYLSDKSAALGTVAQQSVRKATNHARRSISRGKDRAVDAVFGDDRNITRGFSVFKSAKAGKDREDRNKAKAVHRARQQGGIWRSGAPRVSRKTPAKLRLPAVVLLE